MKENKESVIEMDFIEKITLNPLQKYVRFNRFPWKFILHLLLIALCTYQALKIVEIEDKHTRIQEQVFSTIYLQDADGSSSFPFYSLSDFSDSFFSIVNNTENLDETLLQYSDIGNVSYELQIYYNQIDEATHGKMVVAGDGQNFMGEMEAVLGISPENITGFKYFLQQVEDMQLNILGIKTFISRSPEGRLQDCLHWSINIDYSLQSLANVESTLQASSRQCLDEENSVTTGENLIGIHVAVVVVASLSLFLAWRQIYYVSREYLHFKGKAGVKQSEAEEVNASRFKGHHEWQKDWEDLDFLDKLKFFDFWFIVIVAANFFQIFGAVVSLLEMVTDEQLTIFQNKQFLVGLGVMLAWITILKYLEYSPNLNLMSATLGKSWSNLLVFLLGVMPFFLGFVFLGQTIFWKYNKFQDTSSSVITLFSLLNGDIVNDTFLETWAEGLPGQIYLIIFMILFYTAVQNVFVTIIMEGYEESIKQREQKKMLEAKQNQERENFEKNLERIEDMPEEVIASPQLTPQQHSGVMKVRKNGRKVELILQQLSKIFNEVNESELTANEKQYLHSLLKDNLGAIATNIKLQLKDIKK